MNNKRVLAFMLILSILLQNLPVSSASNVQILGFVPRSDGGTCADSRVDMDVIADWVDDTGAGDDWIALSIIDGNGLPLQRGGRSEWAVPIVLPIYPGFITLSFDSFENGPTARPVTVYIYDLDASFNNLGLLGSVTFDPADFIPSCAGLPYGSHPPSSTLHSLQNSLFNPVITAERAQGIYRAYDDHHGIVVYDRPNGDYDFYAPTGCFVGRMTADMFSGIDYGQRYTLHRTGECDGYRVEVWSLGYPACQVQFNLYGPNGYESVYQLARHDDNPTCGIPVSPARPEPPTMMQTTGVMLDTFGRVALAFQVLDEAGIADLVGDVAELPGVIGDAANLALDGSQCIVSYVAESNNGNGLKGLLTPTCGKALISGTKVAVFVATGGGSVWLDLTLESAEILIDLMVLMNR